MVETEPVLNMGQSSHETSRCGPVSVPCPGCRGSSSVITGRGLRVRPPQCLLVDNMAGFWLKSASR